MASLVFSSCPYDAFRGAINFDADIFGVMLVDGSYKPDRSTHTKRSQVIGEIAGDGYAAGGQVVAVTLNRDGDATLISLGAAKWSKATLSARGAVYFKRRGGKPETEELVAFIDFGGDVRSTNADFDLDASSIQVEN
jgi:hypothetical protein